MSVIQGKRYPGKPGRRANYRNNRFKPNPPRYILSRYDGTCALCRLPYKKGHPIIQLKKTGYGHANCSLAKQKAEVEAKQVSSA